MRERTGGRIPQLIDNKSMSSLGSLEITLVLQDPACSSHCPNHEAVPRGQHFIVGSRRHPERPRLFHLLLNERQKFAILRRELFEPHRPEENVLILKRIWVTMIDKITRIRNPVTLPSNRELPLIQERL